MKNTLQGFVFISLPYHMKMLFKRGTAVQFFFQKCYQIISPKLTSFLATNGFFEEKLATFRQFSLVKLHPYTVKKRRIEYIYPVPQLVPNRIQASKYNNFRAKTDVQNGILSKIQAENQSQTYFYNATYTDLSLILRSEKPQFDLQLQYIHER